MVGNFICNSEDETRLLAEKFASELVPGNVVLLSGNLGAGKTFFVRAVCNIFNIPEISSPSFSIINLYSGKYEITHVDFYRIKDIEELFPIGFYDYLIDDSIKFIEWADMFPEIFTSGYYLINLINKNDDLREITIKYYE
ncbi:MAG: tRNA (adenosine(37)-N6)-threonylcarbamoyltransferase complex ATPase subunit type 1 TsaE [Ignavibacteriaceae bacterium]|jgi:tRNA threonylcarbamoyladenosine biosynthesis protein TsaE|nr:tRNA (adenosine(37)-N6)-threonylcarbamoyltransferase complex ATPase subunit type 1 TsaE [Ignavibacteriaceae bacterium]